MSVIAQNPPIFCPLSIIIARYTLKFRLIVDHHAVWSIKSIREPILSQGIAVLEKFVVRRVDANITPNAKWTEKFREMGATNAFTYHDFLEKKTFSESQRISKLHSHLPPHRFLVIAAHGGHPQELLEEEVSAMRDLEDYVLVITGRREKIGQRLANLSLPRNVVYAGYLERDDYESLKRDADVALSLSKEPNTVPHAVHEFVSYGTPTVVLRDELLRSIFDGAIVEAEDSRPASIEESLRKACEDPSFRAQLTRDLNRNYEQRLERHHEEISMLRQALAQ